MPLRINGISACLLTAVHFFCKCRKACDLHTVPHPFRGEPSLTQYWTANEQCTSIGSVPNRYVHYSLIGPLPLLITLAQNFHKFSSDLSSWLRLPQCVHSFLVSEEPADSSSTCQQAFHCSEWSLDLHMMKIYIKSL